MSEIATRWPVVIERSSAAGECEADGTVRKNVVDGWLDAATDEVIARCSAITVPYRHSAGRMWGRIVGPGEASIGAGPTEIHPRSFNVSLKIRTEYGTADSTRVVRLLDGAGDPLPISKDVRDGLIAIVHAARHFV